LRAGFRRDERNRRPRFIGRACRAPWERFRDTAWQSRVRRGLTPVIIGLVTAGGFAMAVAVDAGWIGVGVTVGAAGLLLTNRINPLWLLGAGAVLGGFGLV